MTPDESKAWTPEKAREIRDGWDRLRTPPPEPMDYYKAAGFLQGVAYQEEKAKVLIEEYTQHEGGCIRLRRDSGEPTENGGYRERFAGKWYQSRPVDETPKCDCGLEDALAHYRQGQEKNDGR